MREDTEEESDSRLSGLGAEKHIHTWDTEVLRVQSIKDRDERLKDPDAPGFISHFVSRGLFFENISI